MKKIPGEWQTTTKCSDRGEIIKITDGKFSQGQNVKAYRPTNSSCYGEMGEITFRSLPSHWSNDAEGRIIRLEFGTIKSATKKMVSGFENLHIRH